MKYIKLGNSDLNVSRICMGCMGFGDPSRGQHSWTIGEEQTREIIKRGLELGVNFYDTAIAYQSGTSEQYVGRALRDFAKREDVVVATKFLPRTQHEIENGITGQKHIENMINTSLKNLGMDHVDLYIYHMWDWQTPIYDILDGLGRIVKAGKARYIGISNCFAWQLAKANAIAEKEGFAKFISVQGHYNLIFREEEREMVPFCEEENIALTPYSRFGFKRPANMLPHQANIPTEEICTSPEKYGTEGVVFASKPLVLGGKAIENFGFRFEKGKVVEVIAEEGKEMLEALVNTDEGAAYLGECALVEYHSPISMSGIVYYTTLIDANASCHLALGRALGRPLPEDDPWTLNDSQIHIDFMVGTPDLSIIGTTRDGKEVPVFENGDFVI